MAEFRLHGFPESGNTYKVALLLALAGAEVEHVFVDFFKGETRRADWRATVNAMGEVPVLEHGAERITQSGVALTYLAEHLGRFGGADARERREVLRWLFFDNHKFTSYLATWRFLANFFPRGADPAVMAFLKGRVEAAFAVLDQHLGDRAFVAAEGPTIADLSLAAYALYPAQELPVDIPAAYPAVAAWLDRIRALPGFLPPYALIPGRRYGQ